MAWFARGDAHMCRSNQAHSSLKMWSFPAAFTRTSTSADGAAFTGQRLLAIHGGWRRSAAPGQHATLRPTPVDAGCVHPDNTAKGMVGRPAQSRSPHTRWTGLTSVVSYLHPTGMHCAYPRVTGGQVQVQIAQRSVGGDSGQPYGPFPPFPERLRDIAAICLLNGRPLHVGTSILSTDSTISLHPAEPV